MNTTLTARGPLTSLLRPISRLLRLGDARYFIGHDLDGNSYYEYPSRSGSLDPRHTRRVIQYRIKQAHYSEYDRSQLPIQWKMWLRHTRRVAPTLEELEQDRLRILQLQENVRLIEIRDQEARDRMEQRRLEEQQEALSAPHQHQQHKTDAASSTIPPLGQAPDQTKSEAQASAWAPESAQRTMQSPAMNDQTQPQQRPQQQRDPPPTRKGRAPISAVPTADVNDEGVLRQKQRRVPTSVTQPSQDATTQQGQRAAGQIIEEREADNDVWKASRDRIAKQDNQQQGQPPSSRRVYSTLITPRLMEAFKR